MGGPGSGPRRRRVQHSGLLGEAFHTERPARVLGCEQRGGDILPAECPKCHSRWIEAGFWEARCLCGARWYRLVGEVQRPVRASSSHLPSKGEPDP